MSSIAIQIYGDGEPLVLFHGWGFDSFIWHSVLPDLLALPQPYQIYLVDLPGFGGSANMTWQAFKQQVLASLPAQFSLIGWSLGGLFATRLANEEPSRIRKLLQIASSPYFIQSADWVGMTPDMLDSFYQRFMTAPQLTRQQFVQAQLPKGKKWTQRLEQPINIDGLQQGLAMLKNWDLRPSLGQLTMPVAYLFGRLDRIVSPRTLDYLQACYPHFHYTLLPRSGHMPFLSHRVEFVEWLKEVL